MAFADLPLTASRDYSRETQTEHSDRIRREEREREWIVLRENIQGCYREMHELLLKIW